jgi:hypothetical protein
MSGRTTLQFAPCVRLLSWRRLRETNQKPLPDLDGYPNEGDAPAWVHIINLPAGRQP